MPAIGDLDRMGQRSRCGLTVATAAIARHNVDGGMLS